MAPRGAQLLAAARRGRVIDNSISENFLELKPNAPGFPSEPCLQGQPCQPLHLTPNSSPTMVVNEGSNLPAYLPN